MQSTNELLNPVIRRLTISRFRGIEQLVWYPSAGVNIILGGGDVGKSTVLDAIALLFNPTNTSIASDADYWRRKSEAGFSIEAVMSLPDHCGINQQVSSNWPWHWDGKEPQAPRLEEDSDSIDGTEPVYRLCVRGTEDFDLSFEVLQPDGESDHFSVIVRRKIGLVRLSGDDRNDRDLRLIQGSALDRLISDKTLRSRLGLKLSESDVSAELKAEAKDNLQELEAQFLKRSLPSGLNLGLTGSQGFSLNALIGLTATKNGVSLPLASWGAGTRRLAALEIASAHQGRHPIMIVDEVERGLEPYRQRVLMSALQQNGSQVFLTTHSAAALNAATQATIWYMGGGGTIGQIPESAAAHRKQDPEAFLARITIVAEGPTEIGFVGYILEKAIGGNPYEHGIWITNGGGNDNTLKILEGLIDSGIAFAGFADNEGTSTGKWESVEKCLNLLLFRWPNGCLEENIFTLIPNDRIEEFIADSDGKAGERLRTLAIRLAVDDKSFSAIRSKAPDLVKLLIEAATGSNAKCPTTASKGEKKAWKRHGECWFKSIEGGRELASKVLDFGLWPSIKDQLLPFLNAVREKVSLPAISDLMK
jgi:putative ATP-dependent endonuclease of OLD family